jgi:hypothetical protein
MFPKGSPMRGPGFQESSSERIIAREIREKGLDKPKKKK